MKTARQPRRTTPFGEKLAWYLVVIGVVFIPLVFAPLGKDRFRLPKDLLLRADALLLVTIALLCVVWRPFSVRCARDPVVVITAATLLWATLTAAFSNNQHLSMFALVHVASVVTFFLSTYFLARNRELSVAALVLIPAIPNALLAVLQELRVWNPFVFEIEISVHEQSTGLVGNPNDLGGFLVAPAITAIALAVVAREWRLSASLAGIILVSALFINGTLTAIIAFATGTYILFIRLIPHRRTAIAVLAPIALIGMSLLYPPLFRRVQNAYEYMRAGEYDKMLTARATAFLAALRMLEEHPIVGVGPGCFRFEYYPHKLVVEQEHPTLMQSASRTLNFGEVHNDHLQIAAEMGIPGYALFLLAVIYFCHRCARRSGDSTSLTARQQFASTVALPLATSLLVLMLAQFPLQLAAPTVAFAYVAALCASWAQVPE